MRTVRRLVDWLTLASAAPDLILAQHKELQRQIPLLYALLCVNAVAVASTHFGVAPTWITVWIPGLLVATSLARMAVWLRRPRRAVDAESARRTLRTTTALSAVLAAAYLAWSLGLDGYGGERERAHVAIFVAITVIGCIFCLMHLPQAALVLTAVVTGPYLAHNLWRGDVVAAAIGLNILLVTLVMIRVLLNSFRGFATLIGMQRQAARLNREVTLLAHTDMLTGLPNRRLFFAELDRAIEGGVRRGAVVALGVIDLNRFKAANDTFGHHLGDQLLEAAGGRLRAALGPETLVARLGGDEFAFVVEAEGEAACALANRACEALARPFKFGELTVSTGASCGIATTRDLPGAGMALYDGADYALYNAKSHRRGGATLYSAEHERRIRSERALEAALRAADLQVEMDVHFQPIVRVAEGTVTGVEALARWRSPQLGEVRPDVFIPLAERLGLIHRLTLVLLRKALAHLDWLPPPVALAFNLSAHDLASEETVRGVASLIEGAHADPSRLVLELTETAVLRDFAAADEAIRLLRGLGARIALDDFGTGQSSLSHLRRLPIDRVKIDRSFVAGLDDPSGRDLLAAVVALCRSMRMECVAEGVEDAAQLRFLEEVGCDAFQGYLYARPMPADELAVLFASGRARPDRSPALRAVAGLAPRPGSRRLGGRA